MAKNQYKKEPLKNNVEEMFIGPFGSSLKNECFVDEEDAYCMVYEQKHAIQKTLDGKNRFVDKNKYYELKRFTIKPGDIIVSCRGTIGETFIVPENAPLGIMHPSIMKIRLKPNVYNIEYFNLLLKNRLKDYNKSANGSGIKMAISATELGKELFPIPPMDEQQKTSKIFLMVNHLILLRKQQLAKLDELVKARFVEMFGSYPENENAYPVVNVSDIADAGVGVVIKPAQYYVTEERGIKAFRSLNIGEMYIKDSDWVYFSTEGNESNKKSQLHENDLLIVRSGAPGTSCVVTKEFEGCNAVDVIIAHPNLSKVNPWYLCAYINYPHGKKQIEEGTGGAAQQHFNVGKCNNLKVLLPPLEPQNQFAAFVERVNQQKQVAQQSLEKLELMKKALMQEYFG